MRSLRYKAPGFRVDVPECHAFCETVFPDGSRVPACPQATEEYDATAFSCGYGSGTQARADLSREHEICHHLLALAQGKRYSQTLWAVAQDFAEGTMSLAEQHEEEELVLDFQSYLNNKEPSQKLVACFGEALPEICGTAYMLLRTVPWAMREHDTVYRDADMEISLKGFPKQFALRKRSPKKPRPGKAAG